MGAIRLAQGMAIIDQDECTQCEACLEACPEGAIFGVREPAGQMERLPAQRPIPEVIRVRANRPAPAAAPISTPTLQRTGVLAGVVAYVGRELPRILPALLDALDRRPSTQAPRTTSAPDNRTGAGRRGGGGRGSRRSQGQQRRRRRGGG